MSYKSESMAIRDYLDELDKVMEWAPNHARRLATEAIQEVRSLRAEIERLSERAALVDELTGLLRKLLTEWCIAAEDATDAGKSFKLKETSPDTVKAMYAAIAKAQATSNERALARADAARGEGG